MKKNLIFLLFLLASMFSYSDVKWNGEDGRIRIIYKIVDPLIVTVDTPKKMTVSANQKTFTYSGVTNDHKPLLVTVKSSYNKVDDILRKIYETVYFELPNDGKFTLTNQNTQKVIQGEGYFVDGTIGRATKTKNLSKPFINTVNGTNFTATTHIDSEFTLPEGDVPMGVYTGTLKLNVWFGGSIR